MREFDKTQLKVNTHGRLIHRDYAAHYFRWGFAKRFINASTDVLEIGCGQDIPLGHILGASKGFLPKSYTGIDLNSIKNVPSWKWASIHEKTNFEEFSFPLPSYDVIISLEVIEHMTVEHGKNLLSKIYSLLAEDGVALISTPVFNGKAAKNHIHEYTIEELNELIVDAGFTVQKRYGTFANVNEIKKVASPDELLVFNKIREFYDNDVASNFLAPLHPDNSRNNIWVLRKGN